MESMSDITPQPRVLTKQESDLFRLFEKHSVAFETLLNAGVFTSPPMCKIEINMHNAQIQNVYIHTQTYRRESGKV